ncbi:hypothetical protein ZHAS_00000322 [Anopheles sinensis]|uniref:Uncharacterized protein n=1 Tax=Anopheles sinensis TaxID=74873 RepID=A0A084VA30_ANOSI|nr:hypothetical protein ZHAS_00000322 [Anopheles sinensis]
MKQCTNPPSTTDGAGAGSRPKVHAESRVKGTPNTMTASTTPTTTASTVTSTRAPSSTSVSSSGSSSSTVPSKCSSTREVKGEPKPTGGKAGPSEHPTKPSKHHVPYPAHHYPLHHHLQHHHQMSAKVNGKLGAGVDHLSALNLLPAHLRDMFLAAHLLRGFPFQIILNAIACVFFHGLTYGDY